MKINEILHQISSKRWFINRIHSLLKQADVRGVTGSDCIINRIRRISLVCGSGIVNDVTK